MSDPILVALSTREGDAVTEQLATRLRAEILTIPEVEDVTRATAGRAPHDTRGMDVAAIGALVVAVPPAVDVVERLIRALRGWLGRTPEDAGAELTVTMNGNNLTFTPSQAQQQEIFDAFMKRAFNT